MGRIERMKRQLIEESNKRNLDDKRIYCSNCGWSWEKSESEPDDVYNCHECGKDNSPKTD